LPDESGPPLAKELNNESGPGRDSNLGNAGGSGQRKSSWRNDRIRLLIWAGIAFAPLALILGLHLGGKRNPSVLTVETELPIKAAAAFFVWLATWVVSRVEKRSLADYGAVGFGAFPDRLGGAGGRRGFAVGAGVGRYFSGGVVA